MLTGENYSLLIPTFNRPAMLNALLEYLANRKVEFPIFILDSSGNENKRKNREFAQRYDLDMKHLEFDEDARFDFKIGSALRETSSNYVSLCADDDIIFIDAIEACIDEMDRDPTLAGCHGVYLNFAVEQPLVHLRVEYAAPSIDMDGVIGRACQLLTQYEALNYAVFRRGVMLNIIGAVSQSPADMFWELFSCLVPLVDGKVKRLPCLYHGRRATVATNRRCFDPASWIAEDPDGFGKAFLAYRERLFGYYRANGVDMDSNARKTLTQAHMIYLCRELRDGTGIKHALAGSASPLAKIDPVSAKKSVAKLLAYDSWLGAKIRKIPLVAPGTWIGGKVRQVISRGNIVEFASQSVSFRSSRVIHALLTPEMVADLSLYIQTSRGL